MPIEISELIIRVTLPDIAPSAPVATIPEPCLREHSKTVDGLVKALGFDVKGTVDVPHGYAVGGPSGQVEIFSASGALRARNTDQMAKFEDERRNWSDVVKQETDDGIVYRLGDDADKTLTSTTLRLLASIGLDGEHDSVGVSLGQWALLDDSGKELESGPGRATVQLGYAVDGVKLVGPGAKTNVHFDPDDAGGLGPIARFFHVNRGFDGARDVRLLSLEEAFQPILTQTWSGITLDPKIAKISITAAEYGLLALPADVPQRFAAPVLVVEGTVAGVITDDQTEVELRFGQYLPLTNAVSLAEAGLGSSGPVIPGSVVRGRRKGK
ncbi:MAG: hypothetical protein ABI862_08930 [Ilumatobacteraceae bacterium]